MLSHGSSGFHPRTLVRHFPLHTNVRPHFRRRPLRFHLNPKTRNSSNTSYFPYLSSTLHLRYMLSYPTANPVGPDSDARTSTRPNLSPVTLADRPYCNTPTSVPTYLSCPDLVPNPLLSPTPTSINPHPVVVEPPRLVSSPRYLNHATSCRPMPSWGILPTHPIATDPNLYQPSPYRFSMLSSTFALCLACRVHFLSSYAFVGHPTHNPNRTLDTRQHNTRERLRPCEFSATVYSCVCFRQNVYESIELLRFPSCNAPRSLSAH